MGGSAEVGGSAEGGGGDQPTRKSRKRSCSAAPRRRCVTAAPRSNPHMEVPRPATVTVAATPRAIKSTSPCRETGPACTSTATPSTTPRAAARPPLRIRRVDAAGRVTSVATRGPAGTGWGASLDRSEASGTWPVYTEVSGSQRTPPAREAVLGPRRSRGKRRCVFARSWRTHLSAANRNCPSVDQGLTVCTTTLGGGPQSPRAAERRPCAHVCPGRLAGVVWFGAGCGRALVGVTWREAGLRGRPRRCTDSPQARTFEGRPAEGKRPDY